MEKVIAQSLHVLAVSGRATSLVLQVTSYPINADQSLYAQAQFWFRKFERFACLNHCNYFEGTAK